MTYLGQLSRSQLMEDVHQALKDWYSPVVDESPLSHLYVVQRALPDEDDLRGAANRVVNEALERLQDDWEQEADVLRMRFVDEMEAFKVANVLGVADSTVYKTQREALQRLANVIYTMEEQARAERYEVVEERLGPAPYARLVGVDKPLETLLEQVRTETPPWVISIEGLGGIGKTSLADMLVRSAVRLHLFDEVGWVSAKQQRFHMGGSIEEVDEPALTVNALVEALANQLLGETVSSASLSFEEDLRSLRHRLRTIPHLIVIDNLETVQDVETLLPTVRKLVNPSTIVFTSRKSLYEEGDVYPFAVPELDESSALELIRLEAGIRNRPDLAESSDARLRPIYETVGGNPLALRLIVGQTYIHELNTVLDDVKGARSETIDAFYTFIYRRAWDHLDEPARRVLLAMPMVSEQGGTIDHLSDMSELEEWELRDEMKQLVALNLVDVRGDLEEKRYTIHNLTRAFLLEQVAKWQ